jgi:hypothetical protein
MTAPEETAPGLFPVYREPPVSWLLLGFFVLSVLVHGFAFLLFQVVYPQRVTIPPPSMQVALLTPSSPENQAILRWISAEDPALATAGSVATPPALSEIPFKPSFTALRTPPRTLPALEEKPVAPPSPIALPLLTPTVSAKPAAVESAPPAPSSARFSGALTGRPFTPRAALDAHAATSLEPALFLLAVDGAGQVRNCFRQRTSGDDTADDAAADYLSRGQFTAQPGAPLAWGLATITWGLEIYPTDHPKKEGQP